MLVMLPMIHSRRRVSAERDWKPLRLRFMKRMTSFVKQTIENLAFLVKHRWSLPQLDSVDWTYLETLSTLVTPIDELHECIHYSLHWRQKTFFLQAVVEVTRSDASSRNMRADSVQGHVLLGKVFPIAPDEAHHATGRELANEIRRPHELSCVTRQLTVSLRCTRGVLQPGQ